MTYTTCEIFVKGSDKKSFMCFTCVLLDWCVKRKCDINPISFLKGGGDVMGCIGCMHILIAHIHYSYLLHWLPVFTLIDCID
jgi:hypothetical protein